MSSEEVLALLRTVARGEKTPQEALEHLQTAPYRELSSALTLDMHRKMRTGLGEVVFAPGKNDEQLTSAVSELFHGDRSALVTKLDSRQGELLQHGFPTGTYWREAGIFVLGRELHLAPPWKKEGEVLVVTAGSSDLPVALEALGAGRFFGADLGLIADVGVAGLHRLTPHLQAMKRARILIVVAGMEGALPSVLSGVQDRPIIAVPTSAGYGASLGGIAALLGMLSSCAPGISVVNIDNGFGAAAAAARFLNVFRGS
jgi:hypothetical protein